MAASKVHASVARAASATSSGEVMSGLGALWNLVCSGETCGSKDKLLLLAKEFRAVAGATPPGTPLTPTVAALGSGFALVRAGSYLDGLERLDQARQKLEGLPSDPPSRTVAAVVAVWRGVATAASGRLGEIEGELKRARNEVDSLGDDASSPLRGLLDLGEALREYHVGKIRDALRYLDASDREFAHPTPPAMGPFIGFQAEALLLRGKCLREKGSYSAAMNAIQESQVLRHLMGDPLGEARGCIESARMHRFEGRNGDAGYELRVAEVSLRDRGFVDWECRVIDQRGDIERSEDHASEALAYYNVADDMADHRQEENPLLQAHLDNSRARWHEEYGDPDEAVALIEKHQDTWQGARGYGKYLYLLGSAHRAARNLGLARSLLTEAIPLLRDADMLSYVALASNRLAGVCVERADAAKARGKQEEADELLREACERWAEALRTAQTEVDGKRLLERLRRNAPDLPPIHLVAIIAELRAQLSRMGATQGRRSSEHMMLGHFYMRVADEYLFGKGGGPPPAYLADFHRVLDTMTWWMHDFSLEPAYPEAVDVDELVEQCASKVNEQPGPDFLARTRGECEPFRANRTFLMEALTALFKALRGLGARDVVCSSQGSGEDFTITIEVRAPSGIQFKVADYTFSKSRLTGPKPCEALGYAVLAEFFLKTLLWATIEWSGNMIRIERRTEPTP